MIAGESKQAKSSIKVLVVHDWVDIQDLIGLILGRSGVTVKAVPMKLGAMTAEQDSPDLVVLDSELLSDEEYYRFKSPPTLQDVPILFIDAKPHKMVDEQARRLGADGYILCPFGPQEFLTAYKAVISGETYYPPLSEKPQAKN